jgi:hypothetical protein
MCGAITRARGTVRGESIRVVGVVTLLWFPVIFAALVLFRWARSLASLLIAGAIIWWIFAVTS